MNEKMLRKWLKCLSIIAIAITTEAADQGSRVGCFKRSKHDQTKSLVSIGNCFDHCASQFYRFAVFHDDSCSCENILKESEEEGSKCVKKCRNGEEEVDCGGDETESIYETGSNVPGSVKNLKVFETTEDKITISFDPPERNGTELSGYEINSIVRKTFSTSPWAMRNQTWKVQKSARKFDLSNLIPSTEYSIFISTKNGDLTGGETAIVASTKLASPEPKPHPPKIVKTQIPHVMVEVQKAVNNNGPVSKYLIVVHFVDNELIHDFDETLLSTYQKAQDDGLSYYITAEIEAFRDDTKSFTVGDGRNYGQYFNAPLPNRHLHVLVGVLSRLNGEERVSYSNSSHDALHEAVSSLKTSSDDSTSDILVIILTLACILCGLVLLGSVLFYGYIRLTRMNPRMSRSERHEMSLQGPILEVDNNGFIADVSGINFKEKLQEVLLSLDDHQTIVRKNLSLDIDNILGIGSFGDVIRGQVNGSVPCQVHVVSADDMDPPVQMKFIRDLNNLLTFGFHKNMLNFLGICQTHDWFFVIFEDTPATLKQFLMTQREDQNLANRRLTNFEEDQAMKLMYELSETMEYLQYNKIVHKNLNSHNVRIKRQNSAYTIKLSVFGPTLYSISEDGKTKNMIDEDRWFAPEVLRFQKYSYASDVYSLALVLWEICCVGATVYGSIPTSDLLTRIKKGIRPEKYYYISDDLYQLLLNCWELEPNDRCDFNDIVGQMKHFMLSPQYYLNYALDGPLPYYLPLLEMKN